MPKPPLATTGVTSELVFFISSTLAVTSVVTIGTNVLTVMSICQLSTLVGGVFESVTVTV